MTNPSEQLLYSQIDVSQEDALPAPVAMDTEESRHLETTNLLREILIQQRLQTDLLKRILQSQNAARRQREAELKAWRTQHPELAEGCREVLNVFGNAQQECYSRMLGEIRENEENLLYSDFSLNDFLDRFGPRLMYLNGILQALSVAATPAEN